MTPRQINVLAALKSLNTRKRQWLSFHVLDSYDGRTVDALARRGLVEIHLEHGVRCYADVQQAGF